MNFLLYLISSVTSIVGSGMQSVVIPLYILKVTGSGLEMGKAASIFLVLSLITGPIMGIVADKFNRKYLLIICDFLSFITILILLLSGRTSTSSIILMQGVLVVISRCFSSVSSAIFSELDSIKKVERNNNIYSGIITFTQIFTPILGVALYGFMKIELIFLLNAITFLISGFSEFFIQYTPSEKRKEIKIQSVKSVIASYAPVVKYLKEKDEILGVSGYIIVLNFFFNPVTTIVFSYFILQELNLKPSYIGYLQSVFVIGLLLGNIIIGKFLKTIEFREKITYFLMIQLMILALFMNMDLYIPNPYFIYINGFLILMLGIFNSLVNVPFLSYLQKTVDCDIKGRFFSLLDTMVRSVVPFGLIIFGLLIDYKFNIRSVVTMGSITLTIATYLFFGKTKAGKKFVNKSIAN